MTPNETPTLPLFAQLLEPSEPRVEGGRNAPTTHCLDAQCSKKYPSDGDDCLDGNW